METIIIIAICLVAAGFAASPFIRGREEWTSRAVSKRLENMKQQKELYYQAIKDVDFEYAEGKLTEKDHHELRDYYKEKAIQTIKELEALEKGKKDDPAADRERGHAPE